MKEVNNLSEYLSCVNSLLEKNKLFFRGESVKYEKRVASVNRNPNYDFPTMLKDYYYEVGNNLDKRDIENLIALSQHHGLHTPLLDITSSPLVALYFCVMNNMDNDGFVYTYDSGYSIDISNQLRGYDIEDLVDEFIYLSNPDFLATLFNGLIDLKNNKFEFFYLIQESLVNEILRLKEYECIYVAQLPNFNTVDFIHVLTKLNKFILSTYLSDFDEIMKKQDKINPPICCYYPNEKDMEDSEKIFETLSKCKTTLFTSTGGIMKKAYSKQDILQGNEDVLCYIYILSKYFSTIKMSNKIIPIYEKFPILPYFTYKSSVSFDRMRNQHGSFYYQLATKKKTKTRNESIVISQDYYSKDTIRIRNKHKIKNELENIGIHQKTLFPDLDNVAEWINKKY